MRIVVLLAMTSILPSTITARAMASSRVSQRSAVQRDVEGYAIASCLLGQDQPYLKEQGDGWASVIIQRGRANLDALTIVVTAVKAELAKGHMAIIRNEVGPMPDTALPVLYCSEIIDTPGVREAITKAATNSASTYHRRP